MTLDIAIIFLPIAVCIAALLSIRPLGNATAANRPALDETRTPSPDAEISVSSAIAIRRSAKATLLPLSALGMFGLAMLIYGTQNPDLKTEQRAGLVNAKQLALSLILYTDDYDNIYPYVNSTETLRRVTQPYLKLVSVSAKERHAEYVERWNTHNPSGSRFLFNLALGGVNESAIEDPAKTPMIYESKGWPDGTRVVAFADGHVRRLDESAFKELAGILKARWGRAATRPLPDFEDRDSKGVKAPLASL